MFEINNQKELMRSELKKRRKQLNRSLKNNADKAIFSNIINTPQFKNADIILTYVSTQIEVDTISLINYALAQNKTVAIPKTFPNGIMQFYKIKSLDNLEVSSYGGILEPTHSSQTLVQTTNENILCIVPALSFDRNGYRLGYGGGYYDRYISSHSKNTYMGICYEEFLSKCIIRDEFDKQVKYLITENNIMEVQDG